MSLFIEGATMPETCWECIDKHRLDHAAKCTIHNNLYHRLMNINDPILRQHRAEDCPLAEAVEVTESHGTLIDKEKVIAECKRTICTTCNDNVAGRCTERSGGNCWVLKALNIIAEAPAIVGAEDFNESV